MLSNTKKWKGIPHPQDRVTPVTFRMDALAALNLGSLQPVQAGHCHSLPHKTKPPPNMSLPKNTNPLYWSLPLGGVLLALTGFLVTSYFGQQRQFGTVDSELGKARASLTEMSKSLTEQLNQRHGITMRLGEQLSEQQQRIQDLEKTLQLDRNVQSKSAAETRAEMERLRNSLSDLNSSLEKTRAGYGHDLADINKEFSEWKKITEHLSSDLAAVQQSISGGTNAATHVPPSQK